MPKNRLLQLRGAFSILFWTLVFIAPGYGQISSWTDENGVRHFSNVETSEEKKTHEVMEEYVTEPSDEDVDRSRDRFQILRMYKEDREEEEKQKALEKDIREAEKEAAQKREAEEKAVMEKREACAEHQKRLDDLRHSKWQDYDDPGLSLFACPDRRWKGTRRGKVYDNLMECTERRDRARQAAYDRAVRQLEDQVQSLCAQ